MKLPLQKVVLRSGRLYENITHAQTIVNAGSDWGDIYVTCLYVIMCMYVRSAINFKLPSEGEKMRGDEREAGEASGFLPRPLSPCTVQGMVLGTLIWIFHAWKMEFVLV